MTYLLIISTIGYVMVGMLFVGTSLAQKNASMFAKIATATIYLLAWPIVLPLSLGYLAASKKEQPK